jgi:hypothetical protein
MPPSIYSAAAFTMSPTLVSKHISALVLRLPPMAASSFVLHLLRCGMLKQANSATGALVMLHRHMVPKRAHHLGLHTLANTLTLVAELVEEERGKPQGLTTASVPGPTGGNSQQRDSTSNASAVHIAAGQPQQGSSQPQSGQGSQPAGIGIKLGHDRQAWVRAVLPVIACQLSVAAIKLEEQRSGPAGGPDGGLPEHAKASLALLQRAVPRLPPISPPEKLQPHKALPADLRPTSDSPAAWRAAGQLVWAQDLRLPVLKALERLERLVGPFSR